MSHRWAALSAVLALCALASQHAAGQSAAPRGHKAGGLGQNYPNPAKPETRIPFTVGDAESSCVGDDRPHVVTIKIVNALAQLVATPVLDTIAAGSASTAPPVARGTLLKNLRLPCGAYIAYWDGSSDGNHGKRQAVAAGTYVYELYVDGIRFARKMFVTK